MNINKNPLIHRRRQEQVWSRLMMINVENLAILTLTLNELYPKQFYGKAVRGFFENYIETVRLFDSFDETDTKEYRINQYLAECPCITDELIERLIRHFAGKAKTRLDREIYKEDGLVNLLGENLTLMLLQLHNDYGFGEERLLRTVDAVCSENYKEPLKIIDKKFDVKPEEDDKSIREEVKDMEQARREARRGNRNEVRDRAEAERCLKEFRRVMQ